MSRTTTDPTRAMPAVTLAPSPAPVAESAVAESAAPIEDGRFAPRPTRRTIAMRTFVPWQVVRFAVINLRMLAVIAKSHD